MPPRRPTPANDNAPTGPTRPTNTDELASTLLNEVMAALVTTGITINPANLSSPFREALMTAQNSIQYSLSREGLFTRSNLKPDFELLQSNSGDRMRLAQAITKAYERNRFR